MKSLLLVSVVALLIFPATSESQTSSTPGSQGGGAAAPKNVPLAPDEIPIKWTDMGIERTDWFHIPGTRR